MPNEPEDAKEKRPPHRKRHNAQDDHEGSAHRPEEFDSKNPQKVPTRRQQQPGVGMAAFIHLIKNSIRKAVDKNPRRRGGTF